MATTASPFMNDALDFCCSHSLIFNGTQAQDHRWMTGENMVETLDFG